MPNHESEGEEQTPSVGEESECTRNREGNKVEIEIPTRKRMRRWKNNAKGGSYP